MKEASNRDESCIEVVWKWVDEEIVNCMKEYSEERYFIDVLLNCLWNCLLVREIGYLETWTQNLYAYIWNSGQSGYGELWTLVNNPEIRMFFLPRWYAVILLLLIYTCLPFYSYFIKGIYCDNYCINHG